MLLLQLLRHSFDAVTNKCRKNISQLFFFAIEAATCNAFSAKENRSVLKFVS
jgi:hypothetical protein